MFNLHDFVLTTILKMIGNVQEYQVREYALGWYTKNILTDEDMVVIEETLQPKEVVEDPVEVVDPTEEVIEETTEEVLVDEDIS